MERATPTSVVAAAVADARATRSIRRPTGPSRSVWRQTTRLVRPPRQSSVPSEKHKSKNQLPLNAELDAVEVYADVRGLRRTSRA